MNEQTAAPKSTPMELVRLKAAADEYKVHKSIYIDPVTGEPLSGFMEWKPFRDEFLADWKSNRRVVTEKEADVHFDRIADESLEELEQIGAPADINVLVDQVEQTEVEQSESTPQAVVGKLENGTLAVVLPDQFPALISMPKRRGRPPGVKLAYKGQTNDESPEAAMLPEKRRSKKVAKPARKVAEKKKGGNTSTKAQAIVEKYGPSGRGWSRKDVIAKLTASIKGLGAAYASTLYQKFA